MKYSIQVNVGLVNLAAKYETAVDRDESLATLCVGQPDKPTHDPTPRTRPSTCGVCGPITDESVLKKGIKTGGNTYAVVDQEAVTEAKADALQFKGKIDLLAHPACDVESLSVPGEKLYFLTPASTAGDNQYQLILKLVREHPELAFCGMYTPRSVAALFRITHRGDVLVMEERVTGDTKLKALPVVGGAVDEDMYGMLNEMMLPRLVKPFDAPDLYADSYSAALAELAAKAEVVTIGQPDAKPSKVTTTSDADLKAKLAALKAEVAAA